MIKIFLRQIVLYFEFYNVRITSYTLWNSIEQITFSTDITRSSLQKQLNYLMILWSICMVQNPII